MKVISSTILIAIHLALPCIVLAGDPAVIKPVESSPIKIGTLEFSVVSQEEWQPFNYSGTKWEPNPVRRDEVTVQLRVVNRGEVSVLFPTFDRFTAMLKGPDGKSTALAGNRDGTTITPSILLKPGQGYSCCLIARLLEAHDGNKSELIFRDLTGGSSSTVMTPGVYSLWFQLQPAGDKFSNKGDLTAEVWSATGTTEAVSFKLLPPQSR